MNRAEFQQLSRLRLREARALMSGGHYQGAYYLSGYAVECALKACICKQFGRYEFPDRKLVNDSYTHDLEKLLGVAGLRADLEAEASVNLTFAASWNVVKDWSESARYDLAITHQDGRDFYRACTGRAYGILPWLRTRW